MYAILMEHGWKFKTEFLIPFLWTQIISEKQRYQWCYYHNDNNHRHEYNNDKW